MDILSSENALKYNFILDRSYISNLAYIYATENLNNYYNYRDFIITQLSAKRNIDKLIIFDIEPKIGLDRKIKAKDIIPYPWNDINFLTRLRSFYYEELPKNVSCTIEYVKATSEINLKEILPITYFNNKLHDKGNLDDEVSKLVETFANKYTLGEQKSKCISINGRLRVIYYRTHAIEIDNIGNIRLFDNNTIKKIIGNKL